MLFGYTEKLFIDSCMDVTAAVCEPGVMPYGFAENVFVDALITDTAAAGEPGPRGASSPPLFRHPRVSVFLEGQRMVCEYS